jgi:hypothetical protein
MSIAVATMSRYRTAANSPLKTLSQCALPESLCRRIESRRNGQPSSQESEAGSTTPRDEAFLTEYPADMLLIPKAFIGTALFSAKGRYVGERERTEISDLYPGSGVLIGFKGPELVLDELVMLGAVIAMARGEGVLTEQRVDAERLAYVTGKHPDLQPPSALLLSEATVSVERESFPLIERTDMTNPRQWTYVLGARQAQFFRTTPLEAVAPQLIKDLKNKLARWLVLAVKAERISMDASFDELRQLSGCSLTDGAFLEALRATYLALRERADCKEAEQAADLVARIHEGRKRTRSKREASES